VNVQTLPRTIVNTYLSAARLPLNVVAKARGQQDNEQWPPALAFEGFEAGVETVVGSLLRDDELVEAGRLRQAKIAQLRKAAYLETVADTKREQADQEFAQRREQAEQKRRAAERRAQQREQKVEQDAQQKKAAVDRAAAKKKTAARRTAAAQEEVVDRRERAATVQSLDREAKALQAQQEALDAAKTAEVIEESIEGTKEARQSG
jgi:hypothetical protein